MISIRPLQPADLLDVARIQALSPTAAQWPPVDYLRHLAYAAVCDGVCALAGFLVLLEAAGEFELLTLAVGPHYRRRGVARQLLLHARREHPGRYFLEVRASNEPALQLYRSMGFSVIGTRHAYYAEPREDAIVMELQQ